MILTNKTVQLIIMVLGGTMLALLLIWMAYIMIVLRPNILIVWTGKPLEKNILSRQQKWNFEKVF